MKSYREDNPYNPGISRFWCSPSFFEIWVTACVEDNTIAVFGFVREEYH